MPAAPPSAIMGRGSQRRPNPEGNSVKPSLYFQMIHDPFGDPGLYAGVLWAGRAFLFDLGDLSPLSPRALLKVSDVFVTHTHVDHFIGFDQLLRLFLNREQTLRLYGPAGILENVAGKLRGYTWNLVEDYPFVLEACEYGGHGRRWARFACGRRFRPEEVPDRDHPPGVLLAEDRMKATAAELDHGTPVLGYRLEEPVHLNIDKDRLHRQGIPVGPWLGELKEKIASGVPDEAPFRARWQDGGVCREKAMSLGEWRRELVRLTPGQKIAYVTDIGFTAANRERVTGLAAGVDLFFCEAQFLEQDRDQARARSHLTARQAGLLAREAEAKRLVLFHFSPRYRGREEEIEREAREAFGGPTILAPATSAPAEPAGP